MTKIEWVQNSDGSQGRSWNPITGCTPVSEGCRHCYARGIARRLAGRFGYPEAPHHFDVTLHFDKLDVPLRRKKPTMYFICSMSDLFHDDVPTPFIADLWDIMAEARQHTFQILTKRVDRLPEVFHYLAMWKNYKVPLPNVWLGISVENQQTADERRETFRQCPAAVKFVSYEPALGPVDWTDWEFVSQIISGGESGPGARPSHPDWHRATRDFCQENDIAYFFKAWGAWSPHVASLWSGIGTPPTNVRLVDSDCESLTADYCWMARVGKKAAGRLLDGKEYNEMPNEYS